MRCTFLLRRVFVMCFLASIPLYAQNLENTPFGAFVRTQMDMIALPPSWQENIAPGAFIFIEWQPRHVVGIPAGYRLIHKYLEGPPDDFPPAFQARLTPKVGTTIGFQNLKNQHVDLSVVLGKFVPTVAISHGTRINYPQTKFMVSSIGGNGAFAGNAALAASPALVANLTSGGYDAQDNQGNRVFSGFGQGYLVTTVATVEKLALDVVDIKDFSAGLQTFKQDGCSNDVPASQLKAPDATPLPDGGASGGDAAQPIPAPKKVTSPTKGTLDAAPDASTIIDKKFDKISLTDVKVKLCKVNETRYDLNFTPGVPIAFQAVELRYTGPNDAPRACINISCKIQDLRDAMVLGK